MSESPQIVADRLYGITMRPHELALYGEKVRFSLRYSPMFDDPEAMATQHFKLLVFEIDADLSPADAQARGVETLDLVKCGWELELSTREAIGVATLPEAPGEMPRLLERIADTVNELARRAGLEAPLGPTLVERLLADYRARG